MADADRGAAADRALLCVTTCERPHALRRYLPHFAAFCRADPRFHLVVSHDGPGPATAAFCDRWQVPLVTSDEREGVGISKNRVLTRFPGYDAYFFLDDDVELVDGRVFPRHLDLLRESGIHHFSLFERGGVRRPTGRSVIDGETVVHGMFGGGQFNVYSREGLERVGGWHPRFARYRRWGHTEHSWRFWRAGLAPAPFNVAESLSATCLWHYPPAVTRIAGVPTDADQLPAPERELLDEALEHVPVTTLSDHHVNRWHLGGELPLASVLDDGERYPLVEAEERRRCRADFQLWRSRHHGGAATRAVAFLRGALLWPGNPRLRHQVKDVLARRGRR